MAVLDQSTMAVLDGPEYAAFGHGTIVAGRHSPRGAAREDPAAQGVQRRRQRLHLRRAARLYTASSQGAKVINMSFSFADASRELENGARSTPPTQGCDRRGLDRQRRQQDQRLSGIALERHRRRLDHRLGHALDLLELTARAWRGLPRRAKRSSAPIRSAPTPPRGARRSARRSRRARPRCSPRLTARSRNSQAADAEGNGVWISWEVSKGRLHAPTAIRARTSRVLGSGNAAPPRPGFQENFKVKELQTQLLAVRTSVICAMNQLLDLEGSEHRRALDPAGRMGSPHRSRSRAR